MDLDAWEERAAIMEFDGGLSRFEAETRAAQSQGKQRFEVVNEISKRNSAGQRHHGSSPARHPAGNLPRVQSPAAQEVRSVPERNV